MADEYLVGLLIGMGVLVLVVGIMLFANWLNAGPPAESEMQICASCGHMGHPVTVDAGDGLVELLLWLFAIVPGVFYTFWRRSVRHQVCPHCGGREMLPLTSPRGLELQDRYHKPSI